VTKPVTGTWKATTRLGFSFSSFSFTCSPVCSY
jgi:hypothetical protein